MAEKILNTRIVYKHDTEENWLKATGFIPKQGELIVYDRDDNYAYERFKIGDGATNVNDLPFGVDIPLVTQTLDGLMSAEDKLKLDKLIAEPALILTFSRKLNDDEELPWITNDTIVVWENDTTCKIYGITEIGTNYPGATAVSPLLTTVKFGSYVTSIGSYAFMGCSSLTSLIISNNVNIIGFQAFSGCRSLTSVVIPDSVTSIGGYAFSECTSLTSVVIPASVTEIGSWAFYICESLTSVKILGSTTNIGSLAFADCPALKTVVLNTIVPSDTSYYGAPFPETIEELIVPAESVNAYKTATGAYDTAGWSALSDKITAVATQSWVEEQGYGSGGGNVDIPLATQTAAGLMSATDKTKLNSLSTNSLGALGNYHVYADTAARTIDVFGENKVTLSQSNSTGGVLITLEDGTATYEADQHNFSGPVDFTNATVTGLPTFSFDEATGTLTIVAPVKN